MLKPHWKISSRTHLLKSHYLNKNFIPHPALVYTTFYIIRFNFKCNIFVACKLNLYGKKAIDNLNVPEMLNSFYTIYMECSSL